MADPNEPKKETVRITLPPPAVKPPGASNQSRETVRINLPARPPSTPSNPPVSTPAPLPPKAPPTPPSSAAPAPERPVASPVTPVKAPPAAKLPGLSPSAPSAGSRSPKKETARIALRPDPTKPAPTVQMKKTQPLITMPETVPQSASLTMARVAPSEPVKMVDAIPKPLSWAVLFVSVAILIIQIWNYFL